MKTLFVTLILLTMIPMIQAQKYKRLYDFTATAIDGQPYDLTALRGKKVLIVNVASKCGLTPQYEKLEELYEKYGGDKFVILGFPANNFMGQEPGTNEEIKTFCSVKYGVTFPMMSKISVKGDDMDPIYQWLTSKDQNGVIDAPVSWNFQKFMISEEGEVVGMITPKESPFSDKIVHWIEGR